MRYMRTSYCMHERDSNIEPLDMNNVEEITLGHFLWCLVWDAARTVAICLHRASPASCSMIIPTSVDFSIFSVRFSTYQLKLIKNYYNLVALSVNRQIPNQKKDF